MVKHNHLIIRADIKKPPKDIRFIRKWLRKLVSAIGMKRLGQPVAHYVDVKGYSGLTGFALLQTSHISLHCWDEVVPSLLQLDVYSCKDFDKTIVFDFLKQFEPEGKIKYVTMDRETDIKIYNPI